MAKAIAAGPLAAACALAGAVATAPAAVSAQDAARLAGRVVAVDTDEPVAGAEVLARGTLLRALTDADGRFALTLPAENEPLALVVAAPGFVTAERVVDPADAGAGPVRIELRRFLLDVPGVTVTASRDVARPGEAPASVAVVGGDELRRRGTASVVEALPFAQGVTFNAGQIDIRGTTGIARGVGSRVLVLLDGHRFLSGTQASIDFGGLPLLDVERIEVVKGPHSTLWGANAMAGVVNVVTRRPPGGPRTQVSGYYGVFDTPGHASFTDERLSMEGLQLQHSRRIGTADVTLFAGREGSDGFRQNGWLGRWRLRNKTVLWADSANPWEFFVNWTREDAAEFFTWRSAARRLEVAPEQLDDWTRETNLVTGLTAVPLATSALRLQARPQVYHTRVRNHFHDNDDEHRTTRYGTDLQVSVHPRGRHSITTGFDVAYTEVASNFLEIDPDVVDLAVFAQDEVRIGDRLQGSAGVRLDMHQASQVARDLSVNPKLGLVYRAGPRVNLRASVSRGYRAPSVSEQFTTTKVFGFRVTANYDLRGESAWAGELGATGTSGDRVWFDAALFWSEYDGLIEVAGSEEQAFAFQFKNVAEARVRGLDAGVQVALLPQQLNVHANYMFLDSRDQATGRSLPYRSRHNLTTTISAWRDRLALDMRHRSRLEEVLLFPLDERGPITLLDLRLAARVRDLDFHAKVANLMQAEYVDIQERYPGATRSFRITVTSRF